MKAYDSFTKCFLNQRTHYRLHWLSCLQERGGGEDNVLLSRMLSTDWLRNFNANLVCINATRASDLQLFSPCLNCYELLLLKMHSTGAFDQGKEAMADAKVIRLSYFISPLGLRISLIFK